MRIVGVDPSLTATGIACTCGTSVVTTKKRGPERLFEISSEIKSHATGVCSELGFHPAVVVLEGYSYGSPNQAHQLGELGGCIRMTLWRRGIEVVVVPPKLLKKFATDNGNAGKDAMLAAAIRRFAFAGTNNNEADAYLLWVMCRAAYALRDHPHLTEGLLSFQREAIGKLTLPEVAA